MSTNRMSDDSQPKSTGVISWLSTLPTLSGSELWTDPPSPSTSVPSKLFCSRSTSPLLLSAPNPRKRAANDAENTSPSPSPKLPCTGDRARLTRRAALEEIERNVTTSKEKEMPTETGKATPKKNSKDTNDNETTPASKKKIAQLDPKTPRTDTDTWEKWETKFLEATPPPANVATVRAALRDAGMIYDDEEAWERNPKLRDKVERILDVERNSTLRDESSKRINATIKEYRDLGENTYLIETLPKIFPPTHTVPSRKHDLDGNLTLTEKNYHDADNLRIMCDPHLAKGFVPGKKYTKKAKYFGLTEPVPDRVYGKKAAVQSSGSLVGVSHVFKKVKQLHTLMDWPFCILEGKNSVHPFDEGTNQAIRDGAVILNSRLKLKQYIKGRKDHCHPEATSAAEENLFCFSIVFGPDFVRISVHWYERSAEGADCFHMTPVGQYFLNVKEQQTVMRARVHNIWDWGLVQYHGEGEADFKEALAKFHRDGEDSELRDLEDAAATDEASAFG